MKKHIAIFSPAFIALVMFITACEPADRGAMTEPAITPTPMATPMMTPTPETPSPGVTPGEQGMPEGATHRLPDITGNPDRVMGQTVTVVADIEQIYSQRAFRLRGDSPQAGEARNQLLALTSRAGNLPNIDDQWRGAKVRVTGVVQRMDPRNIEREIGWDLPSNLETEYRGRPVLIARSIERANHNQ